MERAESIGSIYLSDVSGIGEGPKRVSDKLLGTIYRDLDTGVPENGGMDPRISADIGRLSPGVDRSKYRGLTAPVPTHKRNCLLRKMGF